MKDLLSTFGIYVIITTFLNFVIGEKGAGKAGAALRELTLKYDFSELQVLIFACFIVITVCSMIMFLAFRLNKLI